MERHHAVAAFFTSFGEERGMGALASGSWLTRERVSCVAAISAAAAMGMLLFLWLARHGSVDFFGTPVGSDFTAFWNAGRLANAGEAVGAWDPQALNTAIRAAHGVAFPSAWLYPPVFLLVAAPLAALPYLPALLLWQLLSFAAIALTVGAIVEDRRVQFVALASPLTPMALAHGQNAFLTAALLGWGLLLLERRPARAGALLGALIYKPQLALILAPLLLFTRSWRALIAAAAAAAGLVALSLVLWGADGWDAFAASLGSARLYTEQGAVGFYKSASLFAMARQWGASVPLGYAVQATGAIAALYAVWLVRHASPNVRAATACAAAALSTPYLIDYDMAVVGLGGLFLYAEARRGGFLPYERSALAFIWIAPWFSRPAAELLTLPLSPMATVLLIWVATRRARSGHRHAAVDVERLPGDVPGLAAR